MMMHSRPVASGAYHPPLAAIVVTLACLIGPGISGCSEEEPASYDRREDGGAAVTPRTITWLNMSSPIDPAQWLASRAEEHLRPPSDPEVQRIAGLLAAAHRRYRESSRMIANRSVQVEEMLEQLGHEEGAISILDGLTGIDIAAGHVEGYGAISHYYFNLRAADVSREEALAMLKARYGSKP